MALLTIMVTTTISSISRIYVGYYLYNVLSCWFKPKYIDTIYANTRIFTIPPIPPHTLDGWLVGV